MTAETAKSEADARKLHWTPGDRAHLDRFIRTGSRGLSHEQVEAVAATMIAEGCGVWHAVHLALKTPECNCFPCRQERGLKGVCDHLPAEA